jgi:hypothetical protein
MKSLHPWMPNFSHTTGQENFFSKHIRNSCCIPFFQCYVFFKGEQYVLNSRKKTIYGGGSSDESNVIDLSPSALRKTSQ